MCARSPSVLVVWVLVVLACASGCAKRGCYDDDPDNDAVHALIGPAGGTLRHPAGAEVRIPAGALSTEVDISIEPIEPLAGADRHGALLGQAFLFGPEGQGFDRPVELTMNYDPARLPAGSARSPRIAMAPHGSNELVGLATIRDDNVRLTSEILHFSWGAPSGPPQPLEITTGGLMPTGVVAMGYVPSYLAASGGAPPYQWSISYGSLPDGLRIEHGSDGFGFILGTPATVGTKLFLARVTDSQGQAVERFAFIDVLAAGNPSPPLVYSIDASAIVAGAADTVVTLDGEGFASCTAFIGATMLATTCTSATRAQATVPASLVMSPGRLEIGVYNGAGSPSNTVTLTVVAPGTMVVSSVSPIAVPIRSSATVITVTGAGFVAGSAVTFDGATLPTTFGSATALMATIPTNSLALLGYHGIGVSSLLVGGTASNLASFVVVNVVPTITAMSPDAVPAGYATTRVTITGTDFSAGARAFLGAVSLAITIVSDTEAVITVDANELVNPGTYGLTIVNPPPGGGTSAPFPFEVVVLPSPSVLATTPNGVGTSLAVDSTTVYWAENTGGMSAVKSVPIVGGPVTTIADAGHAHRPYSVALGRCNVFWTNADNAGLLGGVMGRPINGGAAGRIASAMGQDNVVRYDAATDSTFWTATSNNLYSATIIGGAPTLVSIDPPLETFELDGPQIIAVSRALGTVFRMAKDGTGKTMLATGETAPYGLVVAGGHAYWATGSNAIRSVDLAGTSVNSIVRDEAVSSLAVDATDVYWTTATEVRSAPLAGGPVTIRAILQAAPRAIAVDVTNVYWLTETGDVVALAKPNGSPPATTNPCDGDPGWAFVSTLSTISGFDLATDGAFVYYTDHIGSGQGHVYKVATNASAEVPTTVALDQYQPTTIELFNDQLYWVNYSNATFGNIMRMSTTGGAPSVFAANQENIDDLAVDGSGAWWVSSVDDTVVHNGTIVASNQGVPLSVALDATFVYWIKGLEGSIYKQLKTGGSPILVTTSPSAGALVVSGGFVYWVNDTSIEKRDLVTGIQTTLATNQTAARSLAVDGTDVYWMTDGSFPMYETGRIKRLTGGVGTPVIFAAAQYQPGRFAFDAQHVYWTVGGPTSDPGGVRKLPKAGRP